MSTGNSDMQYVTRKELREELAPIHEVLKVIMERMETRMATKEDLAAADKRLREEMRTMEMRLRAEMRTMEMRLGEEMRTSEKRLSDDIARHTQASAEETRSLLRALDDKYSDVHPRLDALEAGRRPPRAKPPAKRRARKRAA